jgi:predicted DNA-binding ribbon-helix-helix protein
MVGKSAKGQKSAGAAKAKAGRQGEAVMRKRAPLRIRKRSINIGAHKTSLTLEEDFWQGLKEIAAIRNLSLSKLVVAIDTDRDGDNLSSVIRLYVLDHYRRLAEPKVH